MAHPLLDDRLVHRHALTIAGTALYLASLTLPAIVVGGHDLLGSPNPSTTMSGFACLVSGFFIPPAWIGNLLLVIGVPLLLGGLARAALVLFVIGLISALLAPLTLSVFVIDLARYERPHIGYVFWVASFVMLVVAAAMRRAEARRARLAR